MTYIHTKFQLLSDRYQSERQIKASPNKTNVTSTKLNTFGSPTGKTNASNFKINLTDGARWDWMADSASGRKKRR